MISITLLIVFGFVAWFTLGSINTGLLYRFWGPPEDYENTYWAIVFWPLFTFALLLTGLFTLSDRIIKEVSGK